MLQITLAMLPTVESYFREHLSKNALVIKSKVLCKTVVPEDNHLQELQDKDEEHQEGKTDEERYVNDVSLFSDDHYNGKTDHNCSTEDLCLDTHEESINNDELEIEPCYESFDAIDELFSKCYDNSRTNELASKGDALEEEHTYELLPLEKKEYYEVFPYNGNEREIININCENLILLL
jgi:hypothetical protein